MFSLFVDVITTKANVSRQILCLTNLKIEFVLAMIVVALAKKEEHDVPWHC
jgi:hypothetical protein